MYCPIFLNEIEMTLQTVVSYFIITALCQFKTSINHCQNITLVQSIKVYFIEMVMGFLLIFNGNKGNSRHRTPPFTMSCAPWEPRSLEIASSLWGTRPLSDQCYYNLQQHPDTSVAFKCGRLCTFAKRTKKKFDPLPLSFLILEESNDPGHLTYLISCFVPS